MNRPPDVLFINFDSATVSYQELAVDFAAIEPPTWSLLLAQSCRSKGFGAAILDASAERLTLVQAVVRISEIKPRLACFVVYGQNPNSGTTNMTGNTGCALLLKESHPEIPVCFVGSHTSALPLEVLALPYVDFVLLNEGLYALLNLLKTDLQTGLGTVRGIGFKQDGRPVLNSPERVVPQDKMDVDLPGYAWDLLPFRERPLDLYRAHFWHAEFSHAKRTPFAAIYTSLGCKFKCNFCMINIVNRVDNTEGTTSAMSPNMRFWSPGFILNELDRLAALGVETIRLSDEMFFLNKNYYEPLVTGLAEHGLNLRMWAYSRVDTVRPKYLEMFQKAGINWLALGIEAGSQTVRQEVSKGSFKDVNIREVVKATRASGMNVISNYIFGFPDDTPETMRQTLDLALELCTEMVNMYPCQALPGSPLYYEARAKGWLLPETYAGYAFLSYESQPLPTKHLSARDVLRFRDDSWHTYFSHLPFLSIVETKFGLQARRNVEDLAKIRLRRQLLVA